MAITPLFLKTKLLPPADAGGQLDRPRLIDRLAAGLDRSATLVFAGPGYGKSALVARFLSRRPEPSVWLRLDEWDSDPWMVLRYLIEGLRSHEPEFARSSARLWDSLREREEPVERLTDVFIRDAEESLSERVLVALDGVEHLVAHAATQRMLNRLLDYAPGTLHPILLGRSAADLSLKVAPRQVNRILPDELRFTRDETRALIVECHGLDLDGVTIERIHARTRGWITGLQLVLRTDDLGSAGAPPELFERHESEIFEYFSEAVLASLENDLRELLLAAALPQTFSAELLQDVLELPTAHARVDALLQRRLFVTTLGERDELLELDPLFRDFLQKKLRATRGAAEVRRLERRFGEALDRRGQPASALEHLIASADGTALTASLIRSGKRLLRNGFLDLVGRAASAVLATGAAPPLLHDLLGETARLRGDFGNAVGHFEAALRRDAAPPLEGTARASALQGLAHSQLKLGAVEVAEALGREALALASDDDALTARILNSLAVALYRGGRLDEAITSWQRALLRAKRSGDEHVTLMIAHNLGLPHALMGDFDRAAECFRMLTDPERGGPEPESGAAMLNLARIATLCGDFPGAARLLDDARELARKWGLRSLAADVLEAQGTLLRESGELAEARQKYAEARRLFTELGLIDLVSNVEEEEAILCARLGEPERADRIAEELAAHAASRGDEESRASALLALGEIRAAHADAAAAIEPLRGALAYYRGRQRAYQQCVALVWLTLAAERLGQRSEAESLAGETLALASRYHYDGVLARLGAAHEHLASRLGAHPGCPPALRAALHAVRAAPAAALGAVSPSGVDLRICLLGPVEVHRDQERKIPDSAWKLRRSLKVFCYLAASRGHRATKDRIVDAVWGDASPDAVEKNFHPAISFLRKALNHGHSASKNFILYELGTYRLNPDYRYAVDTEEFESAIRAARERVDRQDLAGALERYDVAIALRRGEFLDELYDEWAESDRQRYETLFREALREAGELHLRTGNLERCVGYLRRLVDLDRTDERVSIHLMTALGALGRRPDVEREFHRLTDVLERELAAAPQPGTRKAYLRAMTEQRE